MPTMKKKAPRLYLLWLEFQKSNHPLVTFQKSFNAMLEEDRRTWVACKPRYCRTWTFRSRGNNYQFENLVNGFRVIMSQADYWVCTTRPPMLLTSDAQIIFVGVPQGLGKAKVRALAKLGEKIVPPKLADLGQLRSDLADLQVLNAGLTPEGKQYLRHHLRQIMGVES